MNETIPMVCENALEARNRRFFVSQHAMIRMTQRRISEQTVQTVLAHGRRTHARGAEWFMVGKKEVEAGRSKGMDLRPCKNVQVLCSPDGVVITVYRSADFRAMKRERRRRGSRRGH